MNKKIKEEIKQYSLSFNNEEACGILMLDKMLTLKFQPLNNIHKDKANFFKIEPSEIERLKKYNEIVAIFHSHPNTSSLPSEFDINSCKSQNIPYLIFGCKDEAFYSLHTGNKFKDLRGRRYVRGFNDEITLIRDYFINIGSLDTFHKKEINYLDSSKDLLKYYFNKLNYKEVSCKNFQPLDIVFFNDNIIKVGLFLNKNKIITQTSFCSSITSFTSAHHKKMCNLYRRFKV